MSGQNLVFLFRGLDPFKVIEKFNNGLYADYKPSEGQLQYKGKIDYSTPTYGRTDLAPIYLIQDRSGCSTLIASDNHDAYNYYQEHGAMKMGGRCDNCKQDYTHAGVPIPVKYEPCYIQVPIISPETGQITHKTVALNIFWGTGEHCSFGCALRIAEANEDTPRYKQDVCMISAPKWLRFVFNKQYPGEVLYKNPKGSLLSVLGPEKFYHNRYGWSITPTVVMLPAKREYIRFDY